MEQTFLIGLLGLAGAFTNGATRLTATILADEGASPRQIARAWSQFVVALVFGPVAAIAFTPTLMASTHIQAAPAAVAVGLSANVLWPIFVEGVVPALRRTVGRWFAELGASLLGQNNGEN